MSIPRPPVSEKFTRRTEVIASAEALLRDFEVRDGVFFLRLAAARGPHWCRCELARALGHSDFMP